jgi:hypothetical protein
MNEMSGRIRRRRIEERKEGIEDKIRRREDRLG